MNTLIASFPKHISEAMDIKIHSLPQVSIEYIQNIVICGMGGSGIGGEIVASWIQNKINIPVSCFHDYTPPSYIDKKTLIIACSYSGNTEETLHFITEAHPKGAIIIGICSGGKMQEWCNEYNCNCIIVPSGFPPRAALAFSIIQIVKILTNLRLINKDLLESILSAKHLIEDQQAEIQKDAKRLSEFIQNTVPIFYATTPYNAILTRARQQFNENSKILCWTQTLPEMNHNELVGWGGGDKRFSAVFFNTNDLSLANQTRLNFTKQTIATKTKTLIITANGENFIERSIYLIHLVDWASLYLAQQTQIDPMDINVINKLKSVLQ